VWGLDAATLAPEGEHAVPYPPRALAVTPDGGDAFVLAGRAAVLRLAPAGGPARPFATLPDRAVGLAATDDQVFTLDPFGDRVWSLDRTRGRPLRAIPTGRSPQGLVLAPAGRS
jgi:DNA-binding beta-propeller fold protein YncE